MAMMTVVMAWITGAVDSKYVRSISMTCSSSFPAQSMISMIRSYSHLISPFTIGSKI